MCCKGFFKRMLPFFAALTIGMFIASFFVPIGRPSFRARGWERHRMNEQLRMENEDLRNENLRLKNELQNQRSIGDTFHHDHLTILKTVGPDVPVVDKLDAPPPPPMPAAPHTRR